MLTLLDAIVQRPVVIDGGLATELEARGHDLSSELWSARLLADDPDALVQVHRAYLDAGAEVVTSASYQASAAGFARLGLDGERMLRRSVELATRARDEYGRGWVAASVGPYGAVLADGSEYRGDYGRSVTELRSFHRPRLEMLAAAGADVLAVETVPCLAEVEALLAELASAGLPAWLAVSCSGDRTRAGEPLEEAFSMAADCAAVFAVGVNCCAPADVPAAVASATRNSGKPAVAYPNSGENWDAAARDWHGGAAFSADDVQSWIAAGARLVGGCCRVGPADIAAVAERIGQAVGSGHPKV